MGRQGPDDVAESADDRGQRATSGECVDAFTNLVALSRRESCSGSRVLRTLNRSPPSVLRYVVSRADAFSRREALSAPVNRKIAFSSGDGSDSVEYGRVCGAESERSL